MIAKVGNVKSDKATNKKFCFRDREMKPEAFISDKPIYCFVCQITAI